MNHVVQDKPSNCGQSCVAMLAGITIELAEKIIGHGHETRTRELVAALRSLGIQCGDRLRRMTPYTELPATAIVKVVRYRHGRPCVHDAHWVVRHDGDIYDPAATRGQALYMDHGVWTKLSSYLEVDLNGKQADSEPDS